MWGGVDVRYVDLEGSLARIGSSEPWRSVFRMERDADVLMDRYRSAMINLAGDVHNPHVDEKTCHICTKRGAVGTVVMACSRCTCYYYCSVSSGIIWWTSCCRNSSEDEKQLTRIVDFNFPLPPHFRRNARRSTGEMATSRSAFHQRARRRGEQRS